MTTPRPAKAAPVAGLGVVALLAAGIFINYVDRGNLATAAPLIKEQLKLTGAEMGLLLSAFFWTYTPSQFLAGWMAERVNPYRTLAIGLAVWAVATIATGLVASFLALLLLRLLLGLGESAAFPAMSKILAKDLPPQRLGFANGLVNMGLALGPAVGTWAGGLLMARVGWREVFLAFGLISLMWIPPWLMATRRLSAHAGETRDSAPPAPPLSAILARREAWGAGLGHFCGNYAFYFVVSWLPVYLVKVQGFSVARMATLSGLIYLVYAASCLITGQLTDLWGRAGASATLVRKTFILAGLVLVAATMLGCTAGRPELSLTCLFLGGIGFGMISANNFAIGQILAGPHAAGKWAGFQNFCANLSGVIAPVLTGFVLDRTGGFEGAFAVACGVALLGLVGWGLMIPRVAPIAWGDRATAAEPVNAA